MLGNLKYYFSSLHQSFLPNSLVEDKRKRIIFYISFYLIAFSVFLTIIGQIPFFADRRLTSLFQITWVFSFVPIAMLDYKRVIKQFLLLFIFLFPFLFYCLIALIFGIESISFSGTRVILLSSYIFFLFSVFGKYKTSSGFKLILFSYLLGATFYALSVFFGILIDQDLTSSIYAFGSKNSAGPIFMSAAIVAFYLFKKNAPLQILVRWLFIAGFITVIALSKNRAVLITVAIILFFMFYVDVKRVWLFFLVLGVTIAAIIIIFSVPYLYNTIVVNIILNNKTTADDISSGRITQIVDNISALKPVLGSGNSKFDCMPLSFLCTYGIVGLLSLLPLAFLPFLFLGKFCKQSLDSRFKAVIVMIIILFLTNSIFEDFGFFGPGAKTIIFWLLSGISYYEVEKSVFSFGFFKKLVFVENLSSRVSSNAFIFIIQAACSMFASIFIVSSLALTTGHEIVDRLPSSNVVADYIESKDIQIKPPVESMCVNQVIKFDVESTPKNAFDKTVFWSTGWIKNPLIDVDGYSGVVKANKEGTALLHIDRFRMANGAYIRFPITSYDSYNFSKLYISTSEFSESFEFDSDSYLNLIVGETSNVYYDNYYLPTNNDFQFVSSDSTIAEVDSKSGIIRAKKEGECKITGILNNKYHNTSVNSVTVRVGQGKFVPVTKEFNVDLTKPCYQYEDYEFSLDFVNNPTDQKICVEATGVEHTQKGNIFNFSGSGVAEITIRSQSNPKITKSLSLNVLENHPTHFVCDSERMTIGETKTTEDLGIRLAFSSGNEKTVTEDDLFFNPSDFKNRAWTNQNGLVKGRTTVMGVKKGTIKLSFVSKIDNNISGVFKIIVSPYSKAEYDNLSNVYGVILGDILICFSSTLVLFFELKKRFIYNSCTIGFALLYLISILIKVGFNLVSILSSTFLIAIVSAILLFRNFVHIFPVRVIEEPIGDFHPTCVIMPYYEITI